MSTLQPCSGASYSFLSGGGLRTAGSDLIQVAIAMGSAAVICEVLRTTSTMLPPTRSAAAVIPDSSVSAIFGLAPILELVLGDVGNTALPVGARPAGEAQLQALE